MPSTCLLVGGLDRLGEQLAERAEIRHRDRQHAGERAEADDVDPDQRPDQRIDAADRIEKAAHRKADELRRNDVPRRQQADRQRHHGRQRGAEQRDRQRLAQRRRDRPAATSPGSGGIISIAIQPSWLQAGQHSLPARNPARPGRRRTARTRPVRSPARRGAPMRGRSNTSGYRARELVGIRAACSCAHARASLPNRRPRSQPVAISMTNTVTMISQQDRADVGVVELADRDDEFLADAAGADEAHHRGAAHVDLEAQQRVAGEAGRHLRQHGEAHAGRSSLRRSSARPRPASCRRSRRSRKTALPSAPVEWIAIASTPAIGPRPKAITKISANTMSGTVRQNSRSAATTNRSHGAGEVFWAAKKFSAKRQHRPGQGADIADQNGLAEQPQPFAPAPEPFGRDRSRPARRLSSVRMRSK